MDFRIPEETQALLDDLDAFIEAEIEPLEAEHPEFFDHRREHARTDWDAGGLPSAEWEALLEEMRECADDAGFYRLALPEAWGGRDIDNLTMALVREHLARRGPGLHNVLPHEASVVGNFPIAQILLRYGSDAHDDLLSALIEGEAACAFGLTEPAHGSDASYMDTTAERVGSGEGTSANEDASDYEGASASGGTSESADESGGESASESDGENEEGAWVIDGRKRWITGVHRADYVLVFARTSGEDGDHRGISGLLVPTDAEGCEVPYYHWTMNMPTDHAELILDEVRVPAANLVGPEGSALRQAQDFVHEGRIRQAASSLGAAQFCIDAAVAYANERETWGKSLSRRQGIQFPLADLQCEAAMLRALVHETAWRLDHGDQLAVSDAVSMANYRANRLACDAADLAMQVHGGMGYSREKPFEHIYRHHRRYRITEGTEQIQLRNVAGHLFGFIGET